MGNQKNGQALRRNIETKSSEGKPFREEVHLVISCICELLANSALLLVNIGRITITIIFIQ